MSTYTVDTNRKIVFISPVGLNDLSSSVEVMDTIVHDPLFGEGFGILCDFQHITYIPGVEDTWRLAGEQSRRFKGHPVALVMPRIQLSVHHP